MDYLASKGVEKIELRAKATNENLPLSVKIVLPEIFTWPASDIAESKKAFEVKRGCDIEVAKLYLDIFTGTHFNRLISTIGKQSEDKNVRQMFENVKLAHERLIEYLLALVEEARPHIVKINPKMELEIDGKAAKAKGAAKRALLTLALMRDKNSFKAEDFNDTYYGTDRAKGDPASEFTTAIRDVRKLLPGLCYDSSGKGQRSVNGVYFIVQPSDDQLKEAIKNMLGEKKQ